MSNLTFIYPWVLLLLPLALLPWWQRRQDTIVVASIHGLPVDNRGIWLHRLWLGLASVLITSLVIGLAKPGSATTTRERVGRGAELLILLDRSSSMDANIRRNAPEPGQPVLDSQSKNDVVREAISWLVDQRPDNQFALMLFNLAPISVTGFTSDSVVIKAALNGTDIGRGPADTRMGDALLSAIDTFSGRTYRGSRSIILVSDGGARLDETMRLAIQRGLGQQRIDLYFIYVQSSPNSPNLETVGTNINADLEEIALHTFFTQLDVDYRVFQAEDTDSLAEAVAEIDQLQNLPLTYDERVPRLNYDKPVFALGLLCALGLSLLAMLRMRQTA